VLDGQPLLVVPGRMRHEQSLQPLAARIPGRVLRARVLRARQLRGAQCSTCLLTTVPSVASS
jgi:hypothetical protein